MKKSGKRSKRKSGMSDADKRRHELVGLLEEALNEFRLKFCFDLDAMTDEEIMRNVERGLMFNGRVWYVDRVEKPEPAAKNPGGRKSAK